VRARLSFELRNVGQNESFKVTGETADLCFEFSSEGELQQALPLVLRLISEGKKIELIYFSPSVEKSVQKLASDHQSQIRALRFPLLLQFVKPEFSLLNWVTSSKLVLVRYDFFPDFLALKLKKQMKLILIWGSLKRERLKDGSLSFYKRKFFESFSLIVWTNFVEKKFAEKFNLPGEVFDFRVSQIQDRLRLSSDKLQAEIPLLLSSLHTINQGERVILGNAWASDLKLLKDFPIQKFFLIVPHSLRPDHLAELFSKMRELAIEYQVMAEDGEIETKTKVVVLVKKGILCELYQLFDYAYVGGGFESSIHSVLEPLVSSVPSISCGPQNSRSTEFDYAQSFDRIKVVLNENQFKAWLEQPVVKKELTFYENEEHFKTLKDLILNA